MIAFFHQNDIFGSDGGGVERYLATLLRRAEGDATFIGPKPSGDLRSRFVVNMAGASLLPRWLAFIAGVMAQAAKIRAFLNENGAVVMEFSRPEYALFAWLFPGARVFTIHGTGPDAKDRLRHVIHHACCRLLPLLADRVQIVGRDASGLSDGVRARLADRLTYIDAWYDDRFRPAAFPPLAGERIRIFYAGRLTAQKNPELLFEIVRRASALPERPFEFHYFGADFQKIVDAGLADRVHDHGFLSPPELAQEIGRCHAGLMCSGFGEGSPFVIVEALACGRPYVLPPLPTLTSAYDGTVGVYFSRDHDVASFMHALMALRSDLVGSRLSPEAIAAGVGDRSQSKAARLLLDRLETLRRD